MNYIAKHYLHMDVRYRNKDLFDNERSPDVTNLHKLIVAEPLMKLELAFTSFELRDV